MNNDIKAIEQPIKFAIKYLSYQPRTIYQMREYIEKKGFCQDIVNKTIEFLLEQKYLNDKDFAELFIAGRAKNNPKSKFALGYELAKKGVNSSISDAILEQYDDQKLALQAVSSKIAAWRNLDKETFKKKVMNFLRYRGFNYDICFSTFTHLQNNFSD